MKFSITIFSIIFLVAVLWMGGETREILAQTESTSVISVSAPFAGAEWIQGKLYQIIWAQQNTDQVDIGWGDCGNCMHWIALDRGVDMNAGSASLDWTVPEDAKPGAQYRITLIGKKGGLPAAPVESGMFKIVENPELRPDLIIESARLGTKTYDTQVFQDKDLTDKDDGWALLRVVNRGRKASGEWGYSVSIAGEAGSVQSLKYRSIATGEGLDIYYHMGIRNAGTKNILFFVDPGSEIFELDEGNNGLQKIFLIKETGVKPDLSLVTVTAQTDKDGVVSELAMTMRAANLPPLGDPLTVRVRAATLGREYLREYSRLLLSSQNTILGLPGSPWPTGSYTVEVHLDPDNRIDEESEANNKLLFAVVMGQFVGFPKAVPETSKPSPPAFETLASSSGQTAIMSPFASASPNPVLINRLKGRMLLQAEGRGELWYLDPLSRGRYYLGTGEAAMKVLRSKGLGISTRDLEKIPFGISERLSGQDKDGDGLEDSLEEALGTDPAHADTDGDGHDDASEVRNLHNPVGPGKQMIDARLALRLEGRILLQVEGKGQAWYVAKGRRYYLKSGTMTVEILKQFMLGVRNKDLAQIPSAE